MKEIPPTRRWFQFKLKTIFLLTTISCVSIPIAQCELNRQQRL